MEANALYLTATVAVLYKEKEMYTMWLKKSGLGCLHSIVRYCTASSMGKGQRLKISSAHSAALHQDKIMHHAKIMTDNNSQLEYESYRNSSKTISRLHRWNTDEKRDERKLFWWATSIQTRDLRIYLEETSRTVQRMILCPSLGAN